MYHHVKYLVRNQIRFFIFPEAAFKDGIFELLNLMYDRMDQKQHFQMLDPP